MFRGGGKLNKSLLKNADFGNSAGCFQGGPLRDKVLNGAEELLGITRSLEPSDGQRMGTERVYSTNSRSGGSLLPGIYHIKINWKGESTWWVRGKNDRQDGRDVPQDYLLV